MKARGFFIVLLMIIVCSMVFAGGAKEEEQVVIKYFQYKPEIVDQLDKMIQLFEEQNPNITVEIETVGKDYTTVFKTKVASNDIPDVYAVQGLTNMKIFVDTGILEDITNEPFMQ